MPTPKMTEAEIISYLAKTSLPTLLVEGESDASIYRWLERQLGIFTGSVLICSGRTTLLSIYRQRHLFTHGKLAWLADLDMWKYSPPATDFSGIIFTAGYSIENDLYADSNIEALMEPAERIQHTQLLNVVCRWLAFEIIEHQSGRYSAIATHINQVVDFKIMDIDPQFQATRNFVEPPIALVNQITQDYKLSFRGKTLIQCISHYVSHKTRNPKYSNAAIIELCLKLYLNNVHMQRLLKEARMQLA